MSKRSLGYLAVILILLMVVVASAGLDNLPGSTRQAAEASISSLSTGRQQFDRNRQQVLAAIASDPSLFRSQEATLRSGLEAAQAKLVASETTATKLKSMLDANRRGDRDVVASASENIAKSTAEAVKESESAVEEAKRWIDYKQHTPELLEDLKSRFEALSSFDVESAAAPVRKAMVDWPEKRQDLESRLAGVNAIKSRATEVWNNTAEPRAEAEKKDYAAVDYGVLIGGLRALETPSTDIKRAVDTTNALASQLYLGRDKVLLDLDDSGPRQRVRVVETKYTDASLQNPQVSNTERWESIDENRFSQLGQAIDMVVERKAPGKYEAETDKRVQAPGYAYIAPAGQSNQYGYWSNGVWSWLPQYLILSQMLRGPSYPPVRVDDYYNYDRYRTRGGTWYGRYGRTWERGGNSGVGGTLRRSIERYTRNEDSGVRSSSRPRERWTWGGSGSSYSDSRYKSRGSFGGSRYQSRPSGSGFGSRSYSRGFGRSFGRGRR